MVDPELFEVFAFKDAAFGRAVEIAEVGWGLEVGVLIDFWGGSAVFPEDSAVLPEGVIFPDSV